MKSKYRICMFILFLATMITTTDSRVFRIGYISGSKRSPGDHQYNRPGYLISGAISLAVNQINEHPDGLLENHTLEFDYAETFGIEKESIKRTATFLYENISAIIGPQETCAHESRLAATFDTLMLSYFCQHRFKTHENSAQYSTFVNVNPSSAQISRSVASVLLAYNWRKVTLIYSDQDESRQRNGESIGDILEDHGILLSQTLTYNKHHLYVNCAQHGDLSTEGHSYDPFNEIVQDSKNKTRIYVIVADQDDLDSPILLLNAMERHRLLDTGEYFVVGVYLRQYDPARPALYLKGYFKEDCALQMSTKTFRFFLGVITTPPEENERRPFNNLVNYWLTQPPFNFADSWGKTRKNVLPQAAFLYDAVFLYAMALDECLKNSTECPNPSDGNVLARYILNKPYRSAMGYLGFIDSDGEAQGNYSLLAMKENMPRGNRIVVGLADIGIFTLSNDISTLPTLTFKENETVTWPFGQVPLDEPLCGFDGTRCKISPEENGNRTFAVLFAGVTGTIIILFFGLILIRHWKHEAALASVIWKIEWEELHVESLVAGLRNTFDPSLDHSQCISLTSLNTVIDLDYTDLRVSNCHTELGLYKKRLVAVKRIQKRHVDFKRRDITKELKTMRELHNDNLCHFIGCCVDPVVCIVMEYCQRGSLQDILYDENCTLDNMFLTSLVCDLVKGMSYIHSSSLKSHGSLKPSNCLIDSQFILKITDYGLHEFKRKHLESPHEGDESAYYSRLLWTAPELLRMHYPPSAGSQSADVYSFGIILFEIYGRAGPFGDVSVSPKEIVTKLQITGSSEPFRPPVDALPSTVPDVVVNLLSDAWNESPQLRPTFQTIKKRLAPIQKGMKTNIMDNIMSLLQRHAVNLEALVEDRTIQLQDEKKKTEALLYEILPRPVAEHLIKEERVEAEQFECVTIFFSDIIGFTSLSADSTPLQVVDMLNDLYTLFDSVLEPYDAYKVETIGDSYMVCSGLPIKNGDRHAAVIASFSLHLLDAIKSFRIRHRPAEPLLLRVGVHSGPVVAGVVGMRMPRYCLFGDTVNTASRFESTGEALKIHCSASCKKILDDIGGYILEPRGLVNMKGKGEQLTYWLIDEHDVTKQLRQTLDLSSQNGASPILPKLDSWMRPRRRQMGFLRNNRFSSNSPSSSPAHSRHKLNSITTLGFETESVKGSMPNLLKSVSANVFHHGPANGNIGEIGTPLLTDKVCPITCSPRSRKVIPRTQDFRDSSSAQDLSS